MDDGLQKIDRGMRNPERGNLVKTSVVTLVGVGLVLNAAWLVGCSSHPETGPVPSKQEIQSDSDRFFNKMEKEEAKKEAPKANP